MAQLVMYVRAACPLCDRLEMMMQPAIEQAGHHLSKIDIDEDPQLHDLYTDRVPVLTHHRHVILEGRPPAEQVAAALAQL